MDRLTRLLLALLAVAVLLAGCAGNNNHPSTDATPPSSSQLTTAAGKALLDQAAASVPDHFGFAGKVLQGASTVMTINTSYTNSTGIAYVDIHADPAALAALSRGGSFGASSFALYHSKLGTAMVANGTAYVFPPTNSSGSSSSSLVTSQLKGSPFSSFLDPASAMEAFQGANVTVRSVEQTTCRGQAALRITFTQRDTNQTGIADVANTDPPRLCHLESSLPQSDASGNHDPLGGGTFQGDFYYADDVPAVPASASRPLGLLYQGPQSSYGGNQDGPITWTFLASEHIPLSDVQAEVKDTSSDSNASPMGGNAADEPTLWTLKLSDKTHTEKDITVTFDDKDHDGMVSQGDTLTITMPQDAQAHVVLKDLQTNTYVVPAPGLAIVLGLLGLAAVVLRRRG